MLVMGDVQSVYMNIGGCSPTTNVVHLEFKMMLVQLIKGDYIVIWRQNEN